MFAIYRVGALPDAAGFVSDLRKAAVAAGLADPFIVKFDTHGNFEDPAATGCDARRSSSPTASAELGLEDKRVPLGDPGNLVIPYDDVVTALLDAPAPSWTRYECVTPSWDNTPRRGDGRRWVVHGSTPDAYEAWLRAVLDRAPQRTSGTPMVFINAWNEWAEGAHLEPDQRWGAAYLRATARAALGGEPAEMFGPLPAPDAVPPTASFEELYGDLYEQYIHLQQRLSAVELSAQRRLDHTVAALEARLREQHELATRLADQLDRRLGSE